MEYLCHNKFTPSNILHYLDGIQAYCVIYNIITTSFRDEKIKMFIRSLKINRPLRVKTTSILTDAMLVDIVQVTAQLETPQVFTALYLLGFFSFLRLSNMIPHSFCSFDISRHLARGDIIFFLMIWPLSLSNGQKLYGIKFPVFIFHSCLDPGYALS